MERYGVPIATQNLAIHTKQQHSAHRHKKYSLPSDKIVHIQGYEPQFLDYVFGNDLLTEGELIYNPKSVKYVNYSGKKSYYFPDFYIPKYNLIIEVKSWYTEKRDKNVELKKDACLQNGFNYLRVVDNKFEEFDKYLKENKV